MLRDESEITDRVQQLLAKEMQRRLSDAAERLPVRCVHNYRHSLDQRKQVEGQPNENYNRITDHRSLPVLQTIGLCMLGSEDVTEWPGTICEEPLDAKRCPYFTPKQNPEVLYRAFLDQLKNGDWIRDNLPAAHALLWVLLKEERVPKVPWYRRLWSWFSLRRLRVEPVLPPFDAEKLLGPPAS
jgi:hypothetical protein